MLPKGTHWPWAEPGFALRWFGPRARDLIPFHHHTAREALLKQAIIKAIINIIIPIFMDEDLSIHLEELAQGHK